MKQPEGVGTRTSTTPTHPPAPSTRTPWVSHSSHQEVNYIFCSRNLFIKECERKSLWINPESDTMGLVAALISEREGLDHDSTSIQLFSREGYAIPLNDYTKDGMLDLKQNYIKFLSCNQ